jgi:UDP-N-acetylmuramoyl-L-alanyl-D-glutamate--2,6-diaminopimelate ligase
VPTTAASSLQRVPIPDQPPTVAELAAAFSLGHSCESPKPSGVHVTGVSQDSTRVDAGDLYVGLPGRRVHGASFAIDAVAAGAVAVLTDPHGVTLLPAALAEAVPVLVVDAPRLVLGPLSSAVNGDPSERLAMFGVTGTNGKTTTSYMVHHLLRRSGVPAGLIGTIAVRTVDAERVSPATTPEAPDLQRMLREMDEAGVDSVALEVSSHALALHRVDGTRFEVVAFTNLSRDHLDFHASMADYFDAKLRLFSPDFSDDAVACVDDEYGVIVAERARSAGMSVLTVSGGGAARGDADVTVGAVTAAPDGSQRFELRCPFGTAGADVTVDVMLPMPGRYNTSNAAVAITVVHRMLQRRFDRADAASPPDIARLASLFADFPGVPGRMQRVVEPAALGRTPLVVVDYAHTPDALTTVLSALRPVTSGRLVAVLGAGGERDTGKRGAMGAAASAVADVVVVTDDNPRSEDPAAIRAAVFDGAASSSRRAGDIVEVADRAAAIARGLAACNGAEDTVVVTGKGHEVGQQYGNGQPTPFDDRLVAAGALRAWAIEAGVVTAGDERPDPS